MPKRNCWFLLWIMIFLFIKQFPISYILSLSDIFTITMFQETRIVLLSGGWILKHLLKFLEISEYNVELTDLGCKMCSLNRSKEIQASTHSLLLLSRFFKSGSPNTIKFVHLSEFSKNRIFSFKVDLSALFLHCWWQQTYKCPDLALFFMIYKYIFYIWEEGRRKAEKMRGYMSFLD